MSSIPRRLLGGTAVVADALTTAGDVLVEDVKRHIIALSEQAISQGNGRGWSGFVDGTKPKA